MSQSDSEKIIDLIRSTEEVADKILVNKQELVELDRRRQDTREGLREIVNNIADGKKVWITVGSMLVKMERDKAIELLKNDQMHIDQQINMLHSEQKELVNQLRDLERIAPYSGTHLKALDRKEINALKANLPIMFKF